MASDAQLAMDIYGSNASMIDHIMDCNYAAAKEEEKEHNRYLDKLKEYKNVLSLR